MNLNHSKSASSACAQFVCERGIEFICLSEPYYYEDLITGFPSNFHYFHHSVKPRSALLICKDFDVLSLMSTEDIVAASVTIQGVTFILVSFYCAPSTNCDNFKNHLRQLDSLVSKHLNATCIILGDFNAKSPSWGGNISDERGSILQNWVLANQFHVLNHADSYPTYSSTLGKSWIDLSIVKDRDPTNFINWEVHDVESASDHNYITFDWNLDFIDGGSRNSRFSWPSLDVELLKFNIINIIGKHPKDWFCIERLDEQIEVVTEQLKKACADARKKTRPLPIQRKSMPWWSPDLQAQRSKTRAFRRKYQKTRDTDLRNQRFILYKRERAKFCKMIQEAKTSSFRQFLGNITSKEVFGRKGKMVQYKQNKSSPFQSVIKQDGTTTFSLKDFSKEVLAHHFPNVDDEADHFVRINNRDIVSITPGEVNLALELMHNGKAPGKDGLPIELFKLIFTIDEEWLTSILDLCISAAHFPSCWKNSKVILLEKPGKDKSKCDAYRPICLLDNWGKILDKIVTNKLSHFLESNHRLNDMQFGFRRHRSAIDALHKVVEVVNENKTMGLMTALISYDIKSAFNTARWSSILHALSEHNIPLQLFRYFKNYLSNRSVTFEAQEFSMVHNYNCGVPQGSNSGPLLWLLVADTLLNAFEKNRLFSEDKLFAFADDFLFVVRANTQRELFDKINTASQYMLRWCEDQHLKLSVAKTQLLIMPPKKEWTRTTNFQLGSDRYKTSRTIKYLGVTIEHNFRFTKHLTSVKNKVFSALNRIHRISRPTWGLRGDVVKTIYSMALEKTILYGCEVWYNNTAKQNQSLMQIQRMCLLHIAKSYSTTSTDALNVLTGTLPITLTARILKEMYLCKIHNKDLDLWGIKERRSNMASYQFDYNPSLLISIDFSKTLPSNTGWEIFTDGSKIEHGSNTQVGSAFVVYHDSIFSYFEMHRLDDDASVYDAELNALFFALKWCIGNAHRNDMVHIFTDSLSSLTALKGVIINHPWVEVIKKTYQTLKNRGVTVLLHWVPAHTGVPGNEEADHFAKEATRKQRVDINTKLSWRTIRNLLKKEALTQWQTYWNNSSKGRRTFDLIKEVSLGRCFTDFFLVQVITGHGVFPAHQARLFGKSDRCPYDRDTGTVEHFVFHCSNFNELRRRSFPRNFNRLTLWQLLNHGDARRGLKLMIKALLDLV